MGPRILATILGPIFALSANPAQTATITATPSSSTATTAGEVIHVVVSLNLEFKRVLKKYASHLNGFPFHGYVSYVNC